MIKKINMQGGDFSQFYEISENGESENFYKQNIVRISIDNGLCCISHYKSLHGELSCNIPYITNFSFPANMLKEFQEVVEKLIQENV